MYWKCQLLFWGLTSLYWAYNGFTGTSFSWVLAIIHFVADLLIYISVSHGYRIISKKNNWHTLNVQQVLIRIVPAIIILGFAFMVLTITKNYLIRYSFQPGYSELFSQHFNRFGLTTFVTGCRLMAIWILAYYGYHFTQREITVIKENARLAYAAKEAAFNNLSAQLNPHFFFNSLNSIKALVLENPYAARRAIDLLSDLLRTALDTKDSKLISLKEEIVLTKDYLELESIRFEDRLKTIIDVDDSLSNILILPLSIQVLVENAIKHGIAQRKEGGAIQIKIEKKDSFLYISIQNPGNLGAIKPNGVGLRNLTERLQLQYNGRAIFKISQEPHEMVLATLIIPVA